MAGSCGAFCSFCGRCGREIAKELRNAKPKGVAPPGVSSKEAHASGTDMDALEPSESNSDHLSPEEGGLHEQY